MSDGYRPSKHECPGCGWKGEWQTHVVRPTWTNLSHAYSIITAELLQQTTLFRICGRCGYTERRIWDTDWEPWRKKKEGDG